MIDDVEMRIVGREDMGWPVGRVGEYPQFSAAVWYPGVGQPTTLNLSVDISSPFPLYSLGRVESDYYNCTTVNYDRLESMS